MKIERSIEQHFKCDGVGSCGVLVKKDLMKKIVKLQAKYLQAYKELLADNLDQIDSYGWGMVQDQEGNHLYHHYVDSSNNSDKDKIERIKFMTASRNPEKIDHVAIIYNRGNEDYVALDKAAGDFFLKCTKGEI